MHQWTIERGMGVERLALSEVETPEAGPGEIRVRLRAASINARDHQMLVGRYFLEPPAGMVPLSDGAGDVTAVGGGVVGVAVGDRVVTVANTGHHCGEIEAWMGPEMVGVCKDGVLREEFTVKATGVTPIPPSVSYETAACVPCAGVTAWNAVRETGGGVSPGDWVLTLGTGGVAMWALQLAKAAGARVIATSSDDDKLQHALALGADATVNYRTAPQWDDEVRRITNDDGVNLVVETGGPATHRRSISATCRFGRVCVVAFNGEVATGQEIPTSEAMARFVTLAPISIGSRDLQKRLLGFIDAFRIEPVIGAGVPFEAAVDAYRLAVTPGTHMGKILITT